MKHGGLRRHEVMITGVGSILQTLDIERKKGKDGGRKSLKIK
jgi:hypothetical protein